VYCSLSTDLLFDFAFQSTIYGVEDFKSRVEIFLEGAVEAQKEVRPPSYSDPEKILLVVLIEIVAYRSW
jgi:hypothetical protein